MAAFPFKKLLGLLLLNSLLCFQVHAGGSGLNTVVIVNQSSSNSCELGNYYCEQRGVPPGHVLRIAWNGGNASWTSNDFQAHLLAPLLSMLAERQLTNQIDYVVLSMDIPFQTSVGAVVNATTSALFYGLKTASGLTNSYAESEAIFRDAPPASAPGPAFLTTMITADTLAKAKEIVDRGVASDGSFPSEPVVLAKSSDPSRNLRYWLFDNAIFNVRLRGVSAILRTNSSSPWGQTGMMGYETGLDIFSVSPGAFVPGAIADSLTSFGGLIFGANPQTDLLAFIEAGATGSYGTVAEPGTDSQKFPGPQVYFYQARGFNLAESYYQSVHAPYFGLTVGEPLSAPFARPGSGAWATNIANSVLAATQALSVRFNAADAAHSPLQRVDLFIDGKYFSTLTNVTPQPGNLLRLSLNGYSISYAVPSNATLSSLAASLASLINAPANSNATKVRALAFGDRIELRSTATNYSNVPFYIGDVPPTNTPSLSYRVAYLPDSFPPRMVPAGFSKHGTFQMEVQMPTAMHYVVMASSNLIDWEPICTNAVAGVLDLEDFDSTNHPVRFYRVVGPSPIQPPALSAPKFLGDGTFQMQVDSVPGLACAIMASTNLIDWSYVFTNGNGGEMNFIDATAAGLPSRFYRARTVMPSSPTFSLLTGSSGEPLVRIDSATRPYTVEVSTNVNEWTTLSTNFAIGEIETFAGAEAGGADSLSTFLTPVRNRFLRSEAFGIRTYTVISNVLPVGAYLQFTLTKTNGQPVVVGITNFSGTLSAPAIAWAVYSMINSNSALQTDDGVAAEDFAIDAAGTTTFNLRARNSGFSAANIAVQPRRSGLTILPSSLRNLTQNWSDLQSRNHLYLACGAAGLNLNFQFDTTALEDGHHELTAVAYEGTHVRTQTRATVPIQIQNSGLSGTLTVLDAPDPAPVSGTYHLEVIASTNDVDRITLFSTGGAIGTVTNQSAATFEVHGTNLWAGLHPFHAVIESSTGLKYRTQTRWVRLVNP